MDNAQETRRESRNERATRYLKALCESFGPDEDLTLTQQTWAHARQHILALVQSETRTNAEPQSLSTPERSGDVQPTRGSAVPAPIDKPDALRALAERCRPAVAHDAKLREREVHSDKYAHHYKAVLQAEAERAAKLLDELDAIIAGCPNSHERRRIGPEACDAPQGALINMQLGSAEWYCCGCGASHLEPACKYLKSVPPDRGSKA
jgi:hypothetical protein